MLKLRASPSSPYGRKTRIAFKHLGLGDRVEWIASRASDKTDPIDKLNPLGKMPVLILENGRPIYDSPVIVEYFDWMAGGGRLIPRAPEARFSVLTTAALADGLMDATINVTHEDRWHPGAQRSEGWVTQQSSKAAKSLAAFEAAPPEALDAGAIGLAAALGYLDRAMEGRWRPDHPRLVRWLADFAEKVPAFAETAAPK
ncbi:MAG TPA: glutathione S-transferase [Beijerinckiaceae bacterium]|nr:glutathione S-transferase [Beijerinckiaceae bacterium]